LQGDNNFSVLHFLFKSSFLAFLFTFLLRINFFIAREACEQKDVFRFIEKFYPDMGHTMERIYPQNSEVRFVDIKAEGYFQVGINITGQ